MYGNVLIPRNSLQTQSRLLLLSLVRRWARFHFACFASFLSPVVVISLDCKLLCLLRFEYCFLVVFFSLLDFFVNICLSFCDLLLGGCRRLKLDLAAYKNTNYLYRALHSMELLVWIHCTLGPRSSNRSEGMKYCVRSSRLLFVCCSS